MNEAGNAERRSSCMSMWLAWHHVLATGHVLRLGVRYDLWEEMEGWILSEER
jgi:hypothetical protein